MDDRGTGSEIAHGKHVRSDVAISNPLKTHQIHQIPKNLQSPTFEMQIRKIDKAIMGGGDNFEKSIKCRKCAGNFG